MLKTRSTKALNVAFSPCRIARRPRLNLYTKHRRLHRYSFPIEVGRSTIVSHHQPMEDYDDESSRVSDSARNAKINNYYDANTSIGSCPAWSIGPLVKKRPTSPSPVCSPVDSIKHLSLQSPVTLEYHSSAPRNLQKSVSAMDGKRSASPKDVEREGREEPKASSSTSRLSPMKHPKLLKQESKGVPFTTRRATVILLEQQGFTKQNGNHKPNPKASISPSSWLPAVSEEHEEQGCKTVHRFRPSPSCQRSSFFSDDGYAGDYSDCEGSAYENSEIESFMDDHFRPVPAVEPSRRKVNPVKRKLVEWKEARTHKLMKELKKKENRISAQEMKTTKKAEMDMRKVELKLEKKREQAMEKMQRRIHSAQKKAARKKSIARESTAKKISKIFDALEKISTTGKLPWMLVLC